MSHWNYRVILKDEQFAIHEVYYRDEGSIEGCTEDPVLPCGDTLQELRDDLAAYSRALEQPPLIFETLGTLPTE